MSLLLGSGPLALVSDSVTGQGNCFASIANQTIDLALERQVRWDQRPGGPDDRR